MNNIVRHGINVPVEYMDNGDLITRDGEGYMVINGEEVQITGGGTRGKKTGLKAFLPSYVWPTLDTNTNEGKYWNTVLELGNKYIEAVTFNPSSGPGEKAVDAYVTLSDEIKKKKIKMFWYVQTGYAGTDGENITHEQIIGNVEKYIEYYGRDKVDGIWLDEYKTDTDEAVKFYKELYPKLKEKFPNITFLGNVGIHLPSKIDHTGIADMFCSFESSSDNWLGTQGKTYYIAQNPLESSNTHPEKFMYIIHSAQPAEYTEIINKVVERGHSKYLYVTSDTMPNPYDGTPENFKQLLENIVYLQDTPQTQQQQQQKQHPIEVGTFSLPYGMTGNYVYNPNTSMCTISVKSYTNITATGSEMVMSETIPDEKKYLYPYEDFHLVLANAGGENTGPTVVTLKRDGGTRLTNRTTGPNIVIGSGTYQTVPQQGLEDPV